MYVTRFRQTREKTIRIFVSEFCFQLEVGSDSEHIFDENKRNTHITHFYPLTFIISTSVFNIKVVYVQFNDYSTQFNNYSKRRERYE